MIPWAIEGEVFLHPLLLSDQDFIYSSLVTGSVTTASSTGS